MSNNLTIVQQIYAAFGRGDVAAILQALGDDVKWEEGGRDYGIPWLRPGRGKEHAARFFRTVADTFDIKSFEPKQFFAAGDDVVVHCRIRATIRPTGQPLADDWEMHVWTLGHDGKVMAFRHVVDTAQHLEAIRPAEHANRRAVGVDAA
jgi:hypothetical protein